MSRWSNVAGTFSIELYVVDGEVFDSNDDELPMLKPYVSGDDELVIEFLSSGYYTPMSMYGGPDRLGWPAEGEDERVLESAYIGDTVLPKDVAQQLFDKYEERILEIELDTEPDYGDY